MPLVFGLGAPLVAMVGTCIGAGQRERALRATWVSAGMAFVMTEAIGLWAAFFPHAWLMLFDSDPAMLAAGALYLRVVGPWYGFFGLGLVVAVGGGWLALQLSGGLTQVFIAQAVGLSLYGLVTAAAVAGGAWFGALGWPRMPWLRVRRGLQR